MFTAMLNDIFYKLVKSQLRHNMIPRLECSEVIFSKCMQCLYIWRMYKRFRLCTRTHFQLLYGRSVTVEWLIFVDHRISQQWCTWTCRTKRWDFWHDKFCTQSPHGWHEKGWGTVHSSQYNSSCRALEQEQEHLNSHGDRRKCWQGCSSCKGQYRCFNCKRVFRKSQQKQNRPLF